MRCRKSAVSSSGASGKSSTSGRSGSGGARLGCLPPRPKKALNRSSPALGSITVGLRSREPSKAASPRCARSTTARRACAGPDAPRRAADCLSWGTIGIQMRRGVIAHGSKRSPELERSQSRALALPIGFWRKCNNRSWTPDFLSRTAILAPLCAAPSVDRPMTARSVAWE